MSGPTEGAPTEPRPESGHEDLASEPQATASEERHGRPRLIVAELVREPGSRVRIRVVLERAGSVHESNRDGVGEEVILLRLAAEATLSALTSLVGRPGYFELVGIKRLFVFDTRVVLTCVRTADAPDRRLVGCVPAPEDLVRGAATAILHATNRIVEALPPTDSADSKDPDATGRAPQG